MRVAPPLPFSSQARQTAPLVRSRRNHRLRIAPAAVASRFPRCSGISPDGTQLVLTSGTQVHVLTREVPSDYEGDIPAIADSAIEWNRSSFARPASLPRFSYRTPEENRRKPSEREPSMKTPQSLVVVALSLVATSFAFGQSHTTTLSATSGAPGDTVFVELLLEIGPGEGPVQGLSYSVQNQDGLLDAVGVSQGSALIENGGASLFTHAAFPGPGGGFCFSAVFSFLGSWSLGPGTHHIATLEFEISPTAELGSSSSLSFCDCLNDPPIASIVVIGGQTVVPALINGEVNIESDVAFRRGDANASGTIDIADAITTLSHLFMSGTADCQAAMDATGDNSVDIADALFVLSYVNGSGPTPPAPFDSCGSGPTVLPCDSFDGCP